jgi:hypothetical protein
MENVVLEEFIGFTLFCEENLNGGIRIWDFLGFWVGIHVGLVRRGDRLCGNSCIWGNF